MKDNMIHGKGSYEWPDDRCYVGEWEKNQMNGKGVYEWRGEGIKYEGQYSDDRKEGWGKMTWNTGQSYEG